MNVRSLALFALAAATLSCGGDSTGPSTGCTITLTGAQTGSFSCTALGAWVSVTDSAAVVISTASTSPSIVLGVGQRGQWTTGTFTNTSAGALGAVSIQNGQAFWIAESAAASGVDVTIGSYTLNLTSVSQTLVTGGYAYIIHGSFYATAVTGAGSTGTGTVTVQATF